MYSIKLEGQVEGVIQYLRKLLNLKKGTNAHFGATFAVIQPTDDVSKKIFFGAILLIRAKRFLILVLLMLIILTKHNVISLRICYQLRI